MSRFKTTSLASKIAHSSALSSLGSNPDLRPLQDLISAEKLVVNSLQKLSADLSRSSESLKLWGQGEGDDLADILSHACSMMTHIANALNVYSNQEQSVRELMKQIRTKEEKLDETKSKRRAVGNKADAAEKKLSKMGSENKNLATQSDLLNRLRDEMRQYDSEIMSEEAKIGDFKRQNTKKFMTLKLGGLLEFAEKATIVGELGKLLVQEIPLETTLPGHARAMYIGHEKTNKLSEEVSRCVGEVVFSSTASNEVVAKPNPADELGQGTSYPSSPMPQGDDLPYTLPPIGTEGVPTSEAPDSPSAYRAQQFLTIGEGGNVMVTEKFDYSPSSESREDVQASPQEGNTTLRGGKFAAFPVRSTRQGSRLYDSIPTEPHPEPEFDPYQIQHERTGAAQGNVRIDVHGSDDEESMLPYKTVRFRTPSQEVNMSPPLSSPPIRRTARQDEGEGRSPPNAQFHTRRVPPPSDMTESNETLTDLEEAKNYAAAKEVGRQLDAFQFEQPSPLLPPTLPFVENSQYSGPTAYKSEVTVPSSRTEGTPSLVIPQRGRKGSQGSLTPSQGSPRGSIGDFPAPPVSTRTISAGAFKKGSMDGGPTSPLQLKKRALPSSPYPAHRMGSGSNSNGPLGPRAPSPSPMEEDEVGKRGGRMSMDGGGPPPPYRTTEGRETHRGETSPTSEDFGYGRLGPVVVTNPDQEM